MATRRGADEERQASEAMLAGILGIAADAIITIDERQRIIHFNSGAEEIFGWRADDAIGQPLTVLLPPRFRGNHEAFVNDFGRGSETARRMGHRREVAGLRRDGSEFPAEASIAKLDLPGGRRVYSAVVRDITERRRAQENEQFLAESSARLAASLDYDTILQTVADCAVPVLGDVCLVDVVDGGSERFGRVGSGSTDGAAGAEALRDLVRDHRLTWDSPSMVIDAIRRGRDEVVSEVSEEWLEAHEESTGALGLWKALDVRSMLIVPLTVGRGTPAERTLGALTLLRRSGGSTGGPELDSDVRALADKYAVHAALALENARLYREARRATRARDDVLGVVSHDLRNPISAIAMCARALRGSDAASPDERQHLLASIEESTEWMNRLIQDLLDVASIEAGRLSLARRVEDVGALSTAAARMFEIEAAQRGIRLRVDVAADLPPVFADGARVIQVLGNLVRNAVKFTPAGGEVLLRVVAGGGGREIVFSVTDTGPGIPVEDQPRVFDRYWHSQRSATTRGTGLGLSIARGIVDAHGGRIWLTSTPGSGSTFSFAISSLRA